MRIASAGRPLSAAEPREPRSIRVVSPLRLLAVEALPAVEVLGPVTDRPPSSGALTRERALGARTRSTVSAA
ncbi:MAG TPA: hypothetical protein VLT32_23600 [Candidatus Sulfomarinibacteraceae bacterium]|nr:hypothetical protein [Candidatus Sulfomarinibacteraceae bacterium]